MTVYQYKGQWLTLSRIGQRVGMSPATLQYRIVNRGMSLDQAIGMPITPYGKRHGDGRQPQLYEFRGNMRSVADIADILGVSQSAVYRRRCGDRILEKGELKDPNPSYQDAPSNARLLTFRGRTNTIAGWAKERGINKETIRHRLLRGWPVNYALTIPPHVGGFDTITYQGRTMPISAWAKEVGITDHALRARLARYGWDVARALNTRPPKTYTFNGRTLTLGQWATLMDLKYATLRERVAHQGWSIERALTEPVNSAFVAKKYKTGETTKTTQSTGGSSKTFAPSHRTGAVSHETDLDGRKTP